jgi:hypothetical protein
MERSCENRLIFGREVVRWASHDAADTRLGSKLSLSTATWNPNQDLLQTAIDPNGGDLTIATSKTVGSTILRFSRMKLTDLSKPPFWDTDEAKAVEYRAYP